MIWNYPGGVQRAVIELKLRYTSTEQTIADGLLQTADYRDRMAADEAHLVIFDRRADVPWDAKIWQRDKQAPGGVITVWGM